MTHDIHDPHEHQPCWELLPWYVNGSLDATRRKKLDQHLATCLVCRRELRYLRRLGLALHTADDASVAEEASLASVLARIDTAECRLRSGSRSGPGAALGAWLREMVRISPIPIRAALAVQFGLLIVATALLLDNRSSSMQPDFVTLTAPSITVPSTRARLHMQFAPETEVASLGELLRAYGARIVEGPTTAGAYIVEFPLAGEELHEASPIFVRLASDVRIASVRVLGP